MSSLKMKFKKIFENGILAQKNPLHTVTTRKKAHTQKRKTALSRHFFLAAPRFGALKSRKRIDKNVKHKKVKKRNANGMLPHSRNNRYE
jgi:hypothetical protein